MMKIKEPVEVFRFNFVRYKISRFVKKKIYCHIFFTQKYIVKTASCTTLKNHFWETCLKLFALNLISCVMYKIMKNILNINKTFRHHKVLISTCTSSDTKFCKNYKFKVCKFGCLIFPGSQAIAQPPVHAWFERWKAQSHIKWSKIIRADLLFVTPLPGKINKTMYKTF